MLAPKHYQPALYWHILIGIYCSFCLVCASGLVWSGVVCFGVSMGNKNEHSEPF